MDIIYYNIDGGIMKTPITYYGGKQKLVKHILTLIPEHSCYVEPFTGGGAVFFAKELAKVNVLNDTFDELVNFYRTFKENPEAVIKGLDALPYARRIHRQFLDKYRRKDYKDNIEKAVVYYYLQEASFACNCGAGFRTSKVMNEAAIFYNRKNRLSEAITKLRNTIIENLDAVEVIKKYDGKYTFFYIDPPYINNCQGHYKGYTEDDYKLLLDTLKQIQGKFILSSYSNDLLKSFIFEIKCKVKYVYTKCHAKKVKNGDKREDRTELLVYNY